MTAQEFVDWIQTNYIITTRTGAVEKASQMLLVTPGSVWKWLSGKWEATPPMLLLMELLKEKHTTKKLASRKLSEEQQAQISPLLGKIPDRQIAAQFGISRFAVQSERYKLGIKRYNGPDGRSAQYP